MGIEQNPQRQCAIKDAISRMEWEGAPVPGDKFPTINPSQESVLDQDLRT